ncbi:MAG: hypothetical protein ACLFR1_08165 [Spirochaetia bacterium]
MKKTLFIILLIGLLQVSLISAQEDWYSASFEAEAGIISVLYHTLQLGENGTVFNFRTQGGQEILFPYERYAFELGLFQRHRILFLYQPLTITTEPVFREPVTVDGVTFPANTSMRATYGFPFWRTTYVYDFIDSNTLTLSAGLALQLRNASIVFASQDGTLQTVSQNLGPVPAIVIAGEYRNESGFFIAGEATGLWASSAIINGADFEFEGSILDASLRPGFSFTPADVYFGLRFIGGTAVGTSEYENAQWTASRQQYTANRLSTLSLTIGTRLRM